MGRTSLLAFLGDVERRASDFRDFEYINDEYDDLPQGPGAYIILAAGRTTWPYPWGVSPVFYIGKADVLADRLSDHWTFAMRAREVPAPTYFPVHQYEANFSSRYCTIPTWQGMTADSVEEVVIAMFVTHYGTRPVANSQTRWNRI